MSELYGIVSLGGTVIGASLNQRGLKGETGATGATGNGIASISKTGSSGLIDTYTITYTNGNTATFTVTNGQDGHSPIITASKSGKTTSVFLDGTKIAEIDDGVGIDSIYKTGSSGLDPVVDEYTILYDDGNYTTFTVTNGKKGDKGDPQSPYTSTPNMDGVGSAGSSSNYSRGDHVHPSDTTKVDKVAGKGLSENDFTDSLKTKLDGIASGAEVNVQSDWNQSTNTADDYIKNKPDLSVYAPLDSPSLTGTPTAPTATEGTNTTQIATTAFVKTADDAVKGMLKDALPTDTASGAIASFPDGSDLFDYLSCVADIDPIQDLHGYDKPWVGGAGKNKFSNSLYYVGYASRLWENGSFQYTITNTGTGFKANVDANAGFGAYFGYLEANKTYTISYSATGQASGTTFSVRRTTTNVLPSEDMDYSKGLSATTIASLTTTGGTFTTDETAHYWLGLYDATSPKHEITLSNVQLELGSTATSYETYSNICPISGHDEVEVSVVGKNLFDSITWATLGNNSSFYSVANDGKITVNANDGSGISARLFTLKAGAHLKLVMSGFSDCRMFTSSSSTLRYDNFIVPSDGKIAIKFIANSYPTTGWAMIVPYNETSPTTYEPYNGTTYTTTLPTTVYGGTLDLVSGVLTVTKGIADFGEQTWHYSGGLFWAEIDNFAPPSDYLSRKTGFICSSYPADTQIALDSSVMTDNSLLRVQGRIYVKNTAYTDADVFKTAMSGVQLCYDLATPTTYQLTPQQIDTLKGQNNVWADCGNVEVQYKADVQMYIEKHITVYNGGVS